MIEFRILSGKKAGTVWAARRFPVRIGRSPKAQVQLEEDGVWDQHLELALERRRGFVLRTQGQALATVNHQPVQEAVLSNGDTIEVGSLKLQFWLSQTRQRGLRFREWLTWAAIALVSLGQVALIYWLSV